MNMLIFLTDLSTYQELLFEWSIYAVLHMIGQSELNERLHDMTPNMMLDIAKVKKRF